MSPRLFGIATCLLAGCDALFSISAIPADPADAAGADLAPWSCSVPDLTGWTVKPFPVTSALPATPVGAIVHPTLDVDHDKILFSQNSDIWSANRTAGGNGATGAEYHTNLSVISHTESAPSMWPDGTRIWVQEDASKLLVSTYGTSDWNRGTASNLPTTLGQIEIGSPSESLDHGTRIVVSTITPPRKLHEFIITSPTEWLEVDSLATNYLANDDRDPYLSSDGCWVLFASNRVSSNDADLYLAARKNDGTFDAPTKLSFSISGIDDLAPTSSRYANEIIWQTGPGKLSRVAP